MGRPHQWVSHALVQGGGESDMVGIIGHRSRTRGGGSTRGACMCGGVCVCSPGWHLAFAYLQPGHGKRSGPLHVPSCDSADRGPVVSDVTLGPDELVVEHRAMVVHKAAASQAALPEGPQPHHLAVHGHHVCAPCHVPLGRPDVLDGGGRRAITRKAARGPRRPQPAPRQPTPSALPLVTTPPGTERSWILATPTGLFTG